MANKKIIVATREIAGGAKKPKDGERPDVVRLKPQEELTAAKKKALGLTNDDVAALVDSGALIEIPAHVSDEDPGDAAAEKKRADAAEAELATAKSDLEKANEEITSLKAQLEAAQAAAAKAQA